MARRKVKLWLLFVPIVGGFYALSLFIDYLKGDDIIFGHDDEGSGSP